jgi:diketogulonate reductase-like aldo/keto reductase
MPVRRKKNIVAAEICCIQAYSPLGSPAMFKAGNVLQHPVVVSTAEKLGKTPAQVALRWGIQTGYSVLPKSTNEERIRANLDIYDWSIPSDLFASFSEIEQASLGRNQHQQHMLKTAAAVLTRCQWYHA